MINYKYLLIYSVEFCPENGKKGQDFVLINKKKVKIGGFYAFCVHLRRMGKIRREKEREREKHEK